MYRASMPGREEKHQQGSTRSVVHPGNQMQPGVTEHKDRDWETRNKAGLLVRRLGKESNISAYINISVLTREWSWHHNL